MVSETVPTVDVVSEQSPTGHMIINRSDFNAEIHTLWESAKDAVEKVVDKMIGKTPEPNQLETAEQSADSQTLKLKK